MAREAVRVEEWLGKEKNILGSLREMAVQRGRNRMPRPLI